uniref:NADH-quinone reductase n=1 Tax=Eiseniibacteriota bacterium TaxID=2212470 RepID=A0A832I0L6_UNCEI
MRDLRAVRAARVTAGGARAALRAAALGAALGAFGALAPAAAAPDALPASDPGRLVRSAAIRTPDQVVLRLARPLARRDAANFRFTEASAPDLPYPIREVRADGETGLVLVVDGRLDPQASYRLEIADPPVSRPVRPAPWALFTTTILAAALINNFVFTRYLGLCVFFGVSRRRDTALGMGATFFMVMVGSGMLSWLLYRFVLRPLDLRFLQILVFIGVVAFMVQLLDTVLKKVHAALHEKFGIYLVLITTNCIILAVPLLNAAADAGAMESLALAMGSGAGFALALFLMSCAREKVELAQVPKDFQGLPLAFALTGLFALAFMGFSGLSFFR